MNKEQVRALLVAELGNIAPEADFATLDAKADLREALDINFDRRSSTLSPPCIRRQASMFQKATMASCSRSMAQ